MAITLLTLGLQRGASSSELRLNLNHKTHGRALAKWATSIRDVVSASGGFVPRTRTRSRSALTLFEREELSRGLARGASLRAIATLLGRGALAPGWAIPLPP
jgi:hypothetical protein